MQNTLRRLCAAAVLALVSGVAAQADTAPAQPGPAQPGMPVLILWPDGTLAPAPPVRQIRATWSTGVFR